MAGLNSQSPTMLSANIKVLDIQFLINIYIYVSFISLMSMDQTFKHIYAYIYIYMRFNSMQMSQTYNPLTLLLTFHQPSVNGSDNISSVNV